VDAEREGLLIEFAKAHGLSEEWLPYLNIALTHKSYSNEIRSELDKKLDKHNQRLEFLGDSVLGLVAADYFYTHKKSSPEGDLTRFKSMTVCEPALVQVAQNLNVQFFLRMGKGESATGGKSRDSNLADAMEALIGAIYLAGGFSAARNFVLKHFQSILVNPHSVEGNRDFKSSLQEALAKKDHTIPEYKLLKSMGPDHEKIFTVGLFIRGEKKSEGSAKTRKQAEQSAAENYLKKSRAKSGP